MDPAPATAPVPFKVIASGTINEGVPPFASIILKVAPLTPLTPTVVELDPVPAVALPNASLFEINTVPVFMSVDPA